MMYRTTVSKFFSTKYKVQTKTQSGNLGFVLSTILVNIHIAVNAPQLDIILLLLSLQGLIKGKF